MDIESLKLFVEVKNAHNITNAANTYYLTQSTVSKRLNHLEAELGIQLFERSKGKSQVVITPEGEAFSELAERMLQLYHQAMALRQDPARKTITIACINSVQHYTLPPLIKKLQQQDPSLCVTLEDRHSMEIFSLLENKQVDVGIVQDPAPFPDLQSVQLFQERYRVVMLPHPEGLPRPRSIHPSQLPASSEIFEAFDSAYRHWHDFWWQPSAAKLRVNTTPTGTCYFNTPEDWMILPESVARAMEEQGFVSAQLEGDPPLRRYFILYRKQNPGTAVERFVEQTVAYFADFGEK